MEIFIDRFGSARCLYSEEIELAALGGLSIRRASQVEPTPGGQWLADLSPVTGPVLGPFASRSQALAAETAWISAHRLAVSS